MSRTATYALRTAAAAALLTCTAMAGPFSSTVQGAILTFEAFLDGLQEVPANASPGTGYAEIKIDDSTGALTVQTGSYSGLLGTSTGVGIYDAPVGSNSAQLFALTLDAPGTTTGTYSGGGILTAGQVTDAIAGKLYVNVRSSFANAGELRGQFAQTPEPSTLVLGLLGTIGALFVLRRRGIAAR